MIDMVPSLIAGATCLGAFALGHFGATARAVRRNGAMAVCVACEHTTAPGALADAVALAKRHKAETGHECMVVKS